MRNACLNRSRSSGPNNPPAPAQRWLIAVAFLLGSTSALAAEAPESPASRPPSAGSDQAVKRALDYLKSTQKPDGAWESGGFGRATSITSLSIMAFLAAGHVPGEPGPYREAVEKGVRWVLAHQRANGLVAANTSHGPMYCHGISTLMLAEVVGMTPDAELAAEARKALTAAVKLILLAQNLTKNADNKGGWRYQPTSRDSDISVTGWQILALRAAKSAGCAVPSENIDHAVDYLKRCASREGGFGYQPGGGPNNPRTGTGILALEICGEHQTPQAVAGAEYLLKHPPRWSSEYFFYEAYYCSQAMFQMGDKYFLVYYPKLAAILLEHQDKNGSWLSGDGNDRTGGRNYCTAMAVLALAVEYRYLPIYQR
ncbi:MAG: terpene cyclase/mutase family protein [Isosphaeraceae bacterium]|nr:terpene cyclase/mutase family protein [Isosphaeraceae bacterium]